MKKFCNKITHNQWRVSVPNLNTSLFRKSTSSCDQDSTGTEKKRISSGSYDLPAAQREYDVHGRVTSASQHSLQVLTDSSSTGSYKDARQDEEDENQIEIYDVVDVHPSVRIVESRNLSQSNNRYEYDVPRIQFCFIEDENGKQIKKEILSGRDSKQSRINDEVVHEVDEEDDIADYENEVNLGQTRHRSQLQIFVTNTLNDITTDIKFDSPQMSPASLALPMTGNPVIKFGSDPNLNLLHSHVRNKSHYHHHRDRDDDCNDSDGSDAFYKVPRRIDHYQITSTANRLSKSLHDFNMDELDLPQLSLSVESIEHISCSQVLPNMSGATYDTSANRSDGGREKATPRRWETFKAKFERFNRAMEDHAATQRVGAFQQHDKYAINIEGMYKTSREKCKRIINKTGKIFKRQDGSGGDDKPVKPSKVNVLSRLNKTASENSSQIVKNDAFFAKITASDIEYVLPRRDGIEEGAKVQDNGESGPKCEKKNNAINEGENREDLGENRSEKSDKEKDLASDSKVNEAWNRKRISGAIAEEVMLVRNNFRKSRIQLEGQNGFDDLRRYVKQGGDFAKELAAILQERSDAELQYSKSLSKLSVKLSRACREGVGGLNEAWKAVAIEMETRAEAHRQMSNVLLEETAKPLKILSENQHRQRKHSEAMVDKAAKVLSEWRVAEGKSKKHSHACARDNEKLQDAMLENRMARSTSLIQLPNIHKTNSDKDNAKLEGKKRKAEDAVKKADIEYYSHCVRSERARLEWESAVLKGASTFQTLEEERLNNLKATLSCYLKHNAEFTPKLDEAVVKIRLPIETAEAQKDLSTFVSLRQSSQQTSEQLLPDFYCEHITLAMNRERRKQALVKLLQLIKLDIERERKARNGLENLSKAIKQTPTFGAEDSQQTVGEKLYHMKSMLTYLEGAKYKVQSALAELDCRPRTGHPLASHITVTRDKAGLQQSILKAPLWLRDQWADGEETKNNRQNNHNISKDRDYDVENNWIDRGMADGNSNQHDSDFDEFSSQGSSICGGNCHNEETIEHIENGENVQPIAECKALYLYTPNLPDELAIRPGDKVVVYRQQEDGWWLGECNGNVGIFPATYVETIKT